ncbi:hypothetical protein NIO33_003989 [Salmonella enterica]|nr:hypothetical protein [Salmonella enterica]
MSRHLKECIDCGKPLSVTAKECNNCKSTDPFGSERFNQKLQMSGVVFLVITAIVIAALAHFEIFNPLDLLKK